MFLRSGAAEPPKCVRARLERLSRLAMTSSRLSSLLNENWTIHIRRVIAVERGPQGDQEGMTIAAGH